MEISPLRFSLLTQLFPFCQCVPVKTVEQQDIKALRSARQLMVEQRTALANQLRAFLAEQGVIIPVGIQSLQHHLPDVLEDENNALSFCPATFTLYLVGRFTCPEPAYP
ncbi:hypothetical protein [Photorhabdus laumondii]|uniref:hypothetical protein n=1 Tax=Photorhabdus laumondii TaxID=2218628 RepID=UPI001F4ED82E|nr:hypothetical protein [Photorhabdus laumondii]